MQMTEHTTLNPDYEWSDEATILYDIAKTLRNIDRKLDVLVRAANDKIQATPE
jgi:hypothetical protein